MYELGIETSVLAQILDGRKTIEGRLRRGKFIQWQIGDVIRLREDQWEDGKIMRSIPERASVRIIGLQHFPTFTDMMNELGHQTVLPDADGIDDALKVYYQFYTPQDEFEYGVVAIVFELQKS